MQRNQEQQGSQETQNFLSLVEKFQQKKVLVIGDVIVDRYLWGTVSRISPEAPVPIVNVQRTQDSLGGAANALRNMRSLGSQVTLCGIVGDDKEKDIVLHLLHEAGVASHSVLSDPATPTIVKTRVMAASQHHHSQQLVRIDREDAKSKTESIRDELADIIRKEIPKHDLVVLSDYGKGMVGPSVLAALSDARDAGLLSLDRRPYVVDPHPVNTDFYRGMTIGTPNRHEAESSAGIRIYDTSSAYTAARILKEKWKSELMAVTLGEEGLVIVGPQDAEAVHLETMAKEVYDVSGAGDCVTAVLALSLASGASPTQAGRIANLAAGIVISEMGTVAIDKGKLLARIQSEGREKTTGQR